MKQNRFTIPANAIRLTAKGVAKTLNATLELFAVLDDKGEPTVAATSSLTGETALVGLIHKVIQHNNAIAVHLDGKAVKTLFNKDVANGSYILVEGYAKDEWESAKAILLKDAIDAAQAEIASIPSETPLKFWVRFGSYNSFATIQMEGLDSLSPRAKKMLEEDAALIRQKKAMDFEYEGDDRYDDYAVPVCSTTFGEFRKVAAELRAAKQALDNAKEAERAAKFAEAKATGQPVQLSFYTAPEHETPLRNDGEGDIVTCCEMAMPDGSIKWEYHHNY